MLERLDGRPRSDAARSPAGAGRIAAHVGDVTGEMTVMHEHEGRHELMWHIDGSMFVETDRSVWQLLPGTAVWLPTGVPHRLCGRVGGRYGWAFVAAEDCPAMWTQPRQIEAPVLTRSLLQHLTTELCATERGHVERVVFDLLQRQLSVPTAGIPVPSDDRCRLIADALLEDPTSDRSLVEWGVEIGAGARTLSRVWAAETGMTFADWRTLLRLRVAVAALGSGADVAVAARRAGYRSASAFVAAFRRQTGRTPQEYVHLLDLGPGDEIRLRHVG